MKDFELLRARDRALYAAYCKGIEEHDFEKFVDAIDYARRQPAPQFFISARNASLAISKLMAGDNLRNVHSTSRRRYREIHARYRRYMTEHPDCRLSRERVCETLVEEPAPEFYLGLEAAKKIIRRERANRLLELQRRYLR